MSNDQWFSVPFIVIIVILVAEPMVRALRHRLKKRSFAELFDYPPDEVICFDQIPAKGRRLAPFIAPIRREPVYFALDQLYGSRHPERFVVFVNVYEAVSPPNRPVNYVSNLAHPNRNQAIDTAAGDNRRCVYRLKVKFKPPSQWPKLPVLPPGDKMETFTNDQLARPAKWDDFG